MTFSEAKLIVERIHREIGWPRCYTFTDYERDQRLAVKSSKRKREKQRMEAERVEEFERSHHGARIEDQAGRFLVRGSA